MRFRILLFSLLALAFSPPSFAQSTAKKFTLNAANQCATIGVSNLPTVGIDVSGTFSLTLQPEVVINGQAPHDFAVTPATCSGSQPCSQVTTITSGGGYTAAVGGYDTFLLCVSAYTSGSAVVQLNPSAANSASAGGAGGAPQQVIFATAYGVLGDGQGIWDATLISGHDTIDCTYADDCNFVSADNGKRCWATNLQPAGFTSQMTATVILPIGNLTVVDSQHATCSGGNATLSATHTGRFFWGHDYTTQLQAAWNAAQAACGILQLPGINPYGTGPARIFVKAAQFSQPSGSVCTQGAGAEWAGPGVQGAGMPNSIIMPTPDFDPTTCTAGGFAADCFGPIYNAGTWRGFQISGGGNSNPGSGFSGKAILDLSSQNGVLAREISVTGWGANATNGISAGIYLGQFQTAEDIYNDGGGQIGCQILDAMVVWRLSCQDNADGNLLVDFGTSQGGGFWSYGGIYGSTKSDTFSVYIAGHSVMHSIGDDMDYGLADSQVYGGWCVGATLAGLSPGTLYMDHDVVSIFPTQSGFSNIWVRANSTLYLSNTQISGTSTSQIGVQVDSTGLLVDEGGNTNSTTVPWTINSGGLVAGDDSITGTAQTSTNIALTNFGTSPSIGTLSGSSRLEQFTITIGSTPSGTATMDVTFPVPFIVTPICSADIVSGTNSTLGSFTPGTVSTTVADFTYVGTLVGSDTLVVQVNCRTL